MLTTFTLNTTDKEKNPIKFRETQTSNRLRI